MIPPVLPKFIGRESELAVLTEWFLRTPTKPILIIGPGGIGKTALVSQFVHTHFRSSRVAWLSAYRVGNVDAEIEPFFSKVRKNPPKIIVIDGVDEARRESAVELVAQQLHTLQPNIALILTSRYPIESSYSQVLHLNTLSVQDSVELLKTHTRSLNDKELEELANVLGNHPLAISLASRLIENMPLAGLLEKIKNIIYDLREATHETEDTIVEVVKPKIIVVSNTIVEHLQIHPEDIYRISPRSFEELIASLLDDMGLEVHLTRQTRDGGRDILAYLNTKIGKLLCLVEAKRYSPKNPVGVDLVRNLYGTLCDEQANNAMLVTTSYFTADAREFQQRHVYRLALKEYEDVVEWINRYKGKTL